MNLKYILNQQNKKSNKQVKMVTYKRSIKWTNNDKKLTVKVTKEMTKQDKKLMKQQ